MKTKTERSEFQQLLCNFTPLFYYMFRAYRNIIPIILAVIIIFISNDGLIGKETSGSAKKKKMYIAGIKGDNVKKQLIDRIRNGITLSVLDNYSTSYQVLDDDAVRVMYSQAEKILASGCDDTSCITQIADGINADEIIYGDVSADGGKVKLVMKSLVRKGMDLDTKSMVNVSFKESQADWFSAETAKKLIDPKYKIDASKAPQEFDSKVDIKGIAIGGVESFNIEVMKFTSSDEAIQNILGYLKDLVKSGDTHFSKTAYKESIEEYRKVVEKIDSKLRTESREKMKSFRRETVSRIDTSYAMIYKGEMEKVDAKLKSEDKADETFLNKIIGKYTDIMNEMKKDIPRQYFGDNTLKVEKAIGERIDSCHVSICMFYEKLGDTAYSGYRFDIALVEYTKSFETAASKLASGEAKSSIEERCSEKIVTTLKTGKSYLENKVKSYMDLAEFYNVKDETSNAKDMIIKARNYMTGSMVIFITAATVENYNKTVPILGMEKITESTDPKLFARLVEDEKNNQKAEQRRLDARQKRAAIAEQQRYLLEIKNNGGYTTAKYRDIEMVKLPGGTFSMGSPESEKKRSEDEYKHEVTLYPFWISKYEVTQRDYKSVMGTNPSFYNGIKLPVEGVIWYEAVEFCNRLSEKQGLKPYYIIDKKNRDSKNTKRENKLKYTVTIAGGNGFRLPTEAEWEYACRGGTATVFHYGDKMDSNLANFDGNSPYSSDKGEYRGMTTPVGSFKPNDYGLYDMHGNVEEWCFDWYGPYGDVSVDPKGADSGYSRVLRGGSWADNAYNLRSAGRNSKDSYDRSSCLGFRIARSVN